MTTYPITLPTETSTQPTNTTFRIRRVVGQSASPFTGEQQTFRHQGEWWEAEVTLPPMKHAYAREWVAKLVSMRGVYGQMLLGDWDGRTARGTASSSAGTPLVNGASQTGNSLIIDGATASQTGYLKAGDYIQNLIKYGFIAFVMLSLYGCSGDIINVSATQETSEIRANGIQISLSGLPLELISAALSDPYQGRTAKVFFGVLDGETVVADPYMIFRGSMDLMTIEDSGETATILVTAESRLIDLDRARARRFTSEDQKIDYPSDKGLEFITSLQEKQIVWGS